MQLLAHLAVGRRLLSWRCTDQAGGGKTQKDGQKGQVALKGTKGTEGHQGKEGQSPLKAKRYRALLGAFTAFSVLCIYHTEPRRA